MREKVVITIGEEWMIQLESIVTTLSDMGLVIESVYEFGVIIGLIDKEKIERLRNLKEIVSIEVEGTESIAPPDSSIQ